MVLFSSPIPPVRFRVSPLLLCECLRQRMSDSTSWTIKRLLEWTTQYLKDHGSSSPRLDAELLLAHAKGCQRIDLYIAHDEEPSDQVRSSYREVIKRRASGMPVAYLVGQKEFFSLSFRVTPDVLIPRPETEYVVIEVLDLVKAAPERFDRPKIIDVGTGSGAIAITLAKQLANAEIVAVDLSEKALEVARSNAKLHDVDRQIRFVCSDVFSELPPGQAFDFVVSNPPYVSPLEFETLDPDVKLYEPHMALVSDQEGMEITRRLIDQAPGHLADRGYLIFETSPMLARTCEAELVANQHFEEVLIRPDLAGLSRVVRASRSAD